MKKIVTKVLLFVITVYTLIGQCSVGASEINETTSTTKGENDKINFKSLTTKDGLSNNVITAFFQDSKGYIWIGTEDGLNKFNGNIIETYNYNREEGKNLSDTHITCINEDINGDIWVGTTGSLNIIKTDENKIIEINNDIKDEYSISKYYITEIYRDSNDNMWVGTLDGLNRYDMATGKFMKYTENDGLHNNCITDIEEDSNGWLWVSTVNGMSAINIETNEIVSKKSKADGFEYIYKIAKDINGDMWISTKGGIVNYDSKKSELINYKIDIGEEIRKDIIDILCDNINNIWFSSANGLIKFDKINNSTKLYKSDTNTSNSLLSDYIKCLYEDRNGVVWIGTDNGVNILNNSQQFSNKINNILKNNDIRDDAITSILEDTDGELWIGTNKSGIINIKDKEVKVYETNSGIISNSINEIIEVDDGIILIATSKGISTINKVNGEVRSIELEKGFNGFNNQAKRILDDEYYIWVATNSGLYKYSKSTSESICYLEDFKNKGIENFKVSDMFQDEYDSNILWLAGGTHGGLIKFHKENGVIKNFVADSSSNTISYDNINCIEGDGLGNLWIGTNSGLSKFNINTEEFTNYTEKDGMNSDFINGIIIDDDSNVWLGTSNGLTKFNTSENTFINYSGIDGLYGTQFIKGSYFKMNSGQLLFGTTNGIVSFNPKEIKEKKYNEKSVLVDNILINDKNIDKTNEEIKLKYNENNIGFEFFLPDYNRIGEVTYLYRLDGLDTEWKYTNNTEKNYKKLLPGKYVFRVKSRRGDGSFTDESSVEFTIKNLFWKTKIAYMLYLIVILIIIYNIFNQVKVLRRLVAKQTAEINFQLEENKKLYERSLKNEKFKNDYFVNLSHELRTPINIILSTEQLISYLNSNNNLNKEKFNHYMGVIKKSSNNLLQIIGDLIDSSKIESGSYKINKKEKIDIVNLVEETALNMSEFIKEKGIELIIDPEIEEKLISCDPIEIERCIINLLGNAVKFTERDGIISIFIKDYGDTVTISVEDTGLGISKEDQEYIFNRFEQSNNPDSTKVSSSGIGLTLVKYIVELHGGKITLKSEINKGSKFTITLPV